MIYTQYSYHIRTYQLDNGQEYMNQHVETFCKEKGTLLEFTTPYMLVQNSMSEYTIELMAIMARST